MARLVEQGRWHVAVVDTCDRHPAQVADAVEGWIVAALTDDALVMHPVDGEEPL